MSIKFPELDKSFLQIIAYSNASFANNRDFTLQTGFVIILGDKSDKVIPLFQVIQSATYYQFCIEHLDDLG